MSAQISEQALGAIRWLVLKGERREAFRLLGTHEAGAIQAMAGDSASMLDARSGLADERARAHLDAVSACSKAAYPEYWAELEEMARGARVPVDDLVLLNLRGDVGLGEISGCSDVTLTGPTCAVTAHNEDGISELVDVGMLLTLQLDGDPAVTVWWYPGFLPSNTFAVSQHGLVWGIDNIRVRTPAPAAGRHFVARDLHRSRSLAGFGTALRTQASAGGFAFNVGELGSCSVSRFEVAAGLFAESAPTGEREMSWHTNHLRFLKPGLDTPLGDSHARARVARGWAPDWDDPVQWSLRVLAHEPAPRGVRRDAHGEDPGVTLVTMVADLVAGTIIIAARHRDSVAIPAGDLVRGIPTRQRPYRRADAATVRAEGAS